MRDGRRAVADPQPEPEARSSFGFLTRKIGPVPIWVIAAGIVGAWYWYTHYGPGAAKAAAAPAAGQRPQVVVVEPGKAGQPGPPGPAGPPGPRPAPRRKRRPRIEPIGTVPAAPPSRVRPIGTDFRPVPVSGPQPRILEPVTAVAPMTAGDIYGGVPTANLDGTTYDSGYPSAAQLEGAYVPAG